MDTGSSSEDRSSVHEISEWHKYLRKCKKSFYHKYPNPKDSKIELEDFHFKQILGTGGFGTVVLANCPKDQRFYAIKVLKREQIVSSGQIKHTLNEKRILMAIDFPFIVNMEHYFKNNCYIFFVMPYVNGGELFTYLRECKRFNLITSSFYASQVILALEYLHYLGIIYRDIKPENILLDSLGYIKLIDLGFAKIIEDRTYTICGTPDYIAPEIILGRGYGFSADWWALGVLIYEMSHGIPPFSNSQNAGTYETILSGKFVMPSHFNKDLKNLITRLLQTDPTRRLGNLKDGVKDIKNHPWFNKINWMDVFYKRLTAPIIPQVTSAGDTSCYQLYGSFSVKTASTELFPRELAEF